MKETRGDVLHAEESLKVFFFVLTGKRSPTQTLYASTTQAPIETKNPQVNLLVSKWQHVWLLALDRRRKLNDALDRLEEVMCHQYNNHSYLQMSSSLQDKYHL